MIQSSEEGDSVPFHSVLDQLGWCYRTSSQVDWFLPPALSRRHTCHLWVKLSAVTPPPTVSPGCCRKERSWFNFPFSFMKEIRTNLTRIITRLNRRKEEIKCEIWAENTPGSSHFLWFIVFIYCLMFELLSVVKNFCCRSIKSHSFCSHFLMLESGFQFKVTCGNTKFSQTEEELILYWYSDNGLIDDQLFRFTICSC